MDITYMPHIEAFTEGYITAALWSTVNFFEDGEAYNLDDFFDLSDIAPDKMVEIHTEIRDFLDHNWEDLRLLDPSQAGHDFALTRDHHGTGFWDRGNGDVGNRLSEACAPYGDVQAAEWFTATAYERAEAMHRVEELEAARVQEEAAERRNKVWEDNNVQFARLLAEIMATQDNLDMEALSESMGLEIARIEELFERAQMSWEHSKEVRCG